MTVALPGLNVGVIQDLGNRGVEASLRRRKPCFLLESWQHIVQDWLRPRLKLSALSHDLIVINHMHVILFGSQEINTGDMTVTRIRPLQKMNKEKAIPN